MFNLQTIVRIQRGHFKGATGYVYAKCNDGTFYVILDDGGKAWIHVTNLLDVTHEDS